MPHFTEDNLQRIIINPFYQKVTRGPLASSHVGELSHWQFLMVYNGISA